MESNPNNGVLLARIDERVDNLTKRVEELIIASKDHATATIQADHEARLRRLEWATTIAIGALSLVEMIGFSDFFKKILN